ncbi:hypothetical protein HNR60_000690 [Rhodopseudomonas rhenobacensis]|uniref:Uncharacterized protein n=1 Tax=Rhodopseudomonas rhenobacensis TaxID=87461 RepID=A0A7W7Z0V7_9BRAD|nr:hypothetical protein [Rhodopseudomonas rhenobacensis]
MGHFWNSTFHYFGGLANPEAKTVHLMIDFFDDLAFTNKIDPNNTLYSGWLATNEALESLISRGAV